MAWRKITTIPRDGSNFLGRDKWGNVGVFFWCRPNPWGYEGVAQWWGPCHYVFNDNLSGWSPLPR
jgi:hypothetical protein